MFVSPVLGRPCLAAVLLSSFVFAHAQETVVVTGSREPTAASRLAADVVVVDAERIRSAAADSLADLLRREAGVQLSRSGGPGQSTGIFIRGAASQQTVLLVDGVRIGSATLGQAAFEALGLASVERIEVLRGPGSSLYGADALGGVVQVFTPRGQAGRQQMDARLALGGHGSREAAASVRGGFEAGAAFDYAVGLSHEASNGVSALRAGDRFGNFNPDDDGFKRTSLHARLGYAPGTGQRVGLLLLRSKLNSQYDSSQYLPPTFAQDNTPDFRTRLDTDVTALDWRARWSDAVTSTLRASRSVDDVADGATEIDRFRTTREQVSAQLAWQAGAIGQLVGVIESQRDRSRSTSFVADVQRRNHAVALEFTGSSGGLSWQADARRDDSSDFGAVNTGRLGGSVALGAGWRARALVGNTFRAPSFNDLYFPNYGVPGLRPEKGRSSEAGLNWKADHADAALTLWHNRVRDLIGYESDPTRCPAGPAYAFGCAGNVARATLQGATLSGTWRAGAWEWRGQWDSTRARDADTGQRLQRRAAQQGLLAAGWRQAAWTMSASLMRLGSRSDGGKTLGAETTLNVRAAYRFARDWELSARLDNATNERIEPVRDYQGLPRQWWLALRWEPKS
jgi:vitamin B12 transporter